MIIQTWKITGLTPLLQNNPEETMKPPKTGTKPKKREYDSVEEAEMRTYRNGKGEFIIPINWFRTSILNGCKGMRIGKIGAATVIQGAVFPVDENNTCIITDSKGKPMKKYEIDIMRVVIQGKGILRARPRFEKWYTEAVFEVDEDFISVETVTELFNRAGKVSGVGDYRPERKGWFGRYKVELIK